MAEEVLEGRELGEAMDESIGTLYREIQARSAPEEPAAPAAAPVEAEPAAEPEAPAGERARDKDGKFVAAKDAPKESAAPAKADTQSKAIEPAAPEQAAADTEPALKFGSVTVDLTRPPSSWKPAAKVAWAALPPAVQAEIYRRETDFSNTVLNGPLKESADFGRTVRGVVEPYRAMIEAEGGTPERAIGDLLKTAQLFRTAPQPTKLQALFQLDQQFGAGLQAFIQQEVLRHSGQAGVTAPQPQMQPPAPPYQDPRVDTLLAAYQQQERERAAQAERASSAAVEQFIATKGADGKDAYPFVDNVLEDMSMRVQALRRQNPALEHTQALKQAYEQAVWANPETRAVLIAAQQAQAVAPAEALRKVADAKRASAGNVPKRGALPATGPAKSLDETIRETARELGMF